MAAGSAAPERGGFDRLREHSIGLPQVLFQSITHMAPAAAVAYSLLLSVFNAGPVLPLAVLLALVACLLAASSIGQLAKEMPSAGGLYTYTARSLGPAPGFLVAWLFLLFEPLVAPFLFLEGGWAIRDVFQTEVGWHYTGQWWIWVLVLAAIVFMLTYRDIRISATAGVLLGVFEIAVFGALAIWMLISNGSHLNLAAFNPDHSPSGYTGVFKGMVFAILAFIGFEASAPLGEEAKNPRRTIPRAVVYSCLSIGVFYLLASYAWVYGAGFDNFVHQATTNPDPWRSLAKLFWAGGWVLVFVAIVNSIVANSNAGFNAATRVFYAMARNGAAPAPLARTHPQFKTPYVAIIINTIIAVTLSIVLGWKWGPLNGFYMLATAATVVVILVYMLVMAGCSVYYWRAGRFNVLLHGVFPLGGIVLFAFPLFYQYHPIPPAPLNYAVWFAVGWVVLGLLVTAVMARRKPEALSNAKRIYVEDETFVPVA
jgi:amino acid transporter